MSDNTYISIVQEDKSHFHIRHKDADTEETIESLGIEHTLEDAVRMANEWNYGVEYGLEIQLEKKK